jgi:hypothetical protein
MTTTTTLHHLPDSWLPKKRRTKAMLAVCVRPCYSHQCRRRQAHHAANHRQTNDPFGSLRAYFTKVGFWSQSMPQSQFCRVEQLSNVAYHSSARVLECAAVQGPSTRTQIGVSLLIARLSTTGANRLSTTRQLRRQYWRRSTASGNQKHRNKTEREKREKRNLQRFLDVSVRSQVYLVGCVGAPRWSR